MEGRPLDRIALILIVLAFPTSAVGQISGVVQTVDGQPIPAASIQVWAQAELLAESATDNRGVFSIDIPLAEVRRLGLLI